MVLNPGTIFLFLLFYIACLVGATGSKRPFYRRMWGVAACVLGLACIVSGFVMIAGVLAAVAAI